MKYTFGFYGEIAVIADSEEEAFETADKLVTPTAYASDHCEDIFIGNIELIEAEEED